MKATKLTIILAAAALFALTSCDKFLDVNPDKRAEVDTKEEMSSLLGSAYTTHVMISMAEMMSDNIDDFGLTSFNNSKRFLEQVYKFEEITESDNESPENCWSDYWRGIAATNVVLEGLAELGTPEANPDLREIYGEAYIARAYNHFILGTMFCMPYDPAHAASDPGLPYLTAVEKGFNIQHERGSVADLYAAIERISNAVSRWWATPATGFPSITSTSLRPTLSPAVSTSTTASTTRQSNVPTTCSASPRPRC